jgi:diguanylate cyclase (GGDEF)-like protein
MEFNPPASNLTANLVAVGARMVSIFPLGITARLTISLAAVAVLAAAANMIAQESVSIIRMSTVPRSIPPAAHPSAPSRKNIDALTSAVDRYERASQLRAEIDSDTNNAGYLSATNKLRNSSLDYREGASAKSAMVAEVGRLVAEYLDRGKALIHVADQRRSARVEYSDHSEAIDRRMQQSLDGALKIFGHVIARQSQIQLRSYLDAIRQHSRNIVSGDAVSTDEIDILAANENAFAASFEAHRKSLEKSDGLNWVRGIQEDFYSLVTLRASLYALNVQYDDEVQQFSHAHSLLAAATTAASAWSPPPISAVTAPTGDTVTETTLKETDPNTRNLLAAVTTIVILFITAISIATVRSVLAPVHRILRATAQLASGDMRVEVSRGGIRELDTLASAFNEMAAKLAAAQDLSRYQQESLEETVLERTHKLQQLALQDPLTSLPNRRHLSALLSTAIDRASRDDRHIGVYFIDIDNFKNFNDSLGHAFGDRVLMSVANRLEEFVDGLGFVARLGGDEFTLVYESAMSVEAIHATGRNLVDAFHQLVSVDDRELSISVSVGASIFPEHGWDTEGLLRAADSALFRAKELGRSQLAVFTPELIKTAATRFMIEQGLRRAIEGSEFELVYQPEINLATSETELVEALLRWRMPDGRLAKPGEFLAVAEQSGLISGINTWVLRTAVEDASRWYHGEWPDVCVAINISPRQLLDHRFIEQILALLLEFRLPAHCIEFELTEMVLQTGATTIAALRVLHSHGFGIALDDFGTGYSSLASLELLPLSRIKLDRSLVASIDTSARSAAIARAIIDLCAGLGLQVTAEGIERPQQFAWLLDNHAMLLQGYLLSDAVPFAEVLPVKALLADRIQDLLLSLPAPPRRRVPEPIDAMSMVNL